jgi:hypothetical protein
MIKFNENKRCPICKKPLKKFQYWDLPEWIYQCRDCNYMIHYLQPFLELRLGEFYVCVKARKKASYIKKGKKNYHDAFMEFGREIRKKLFMEGKL